VCRGDCKAVTVDDKIYVLGGAVERKTGVKDDSIDCDNLENPEVDWVQCYEFSNATEVRASCSMLGTASMPSQQPCMLPSLLLQPHGAQPYGASTLWCSTLWCPHCCFNPMVHYALTAASTLWCIMPSLLLQPYAALCPHCCFNPMLHCALTAASTPWMPHAEV